MQGLNQQSADFVPTSETVTLRGGPHFDLFSSCNFRSDEQIDPSSLDPHGSKQLLHLINLVKGMLISPTKEVRLATAADILKVEPKCGLALAVMAREGAVTESEVDSYYRQSVESLYAEVGSADKSNAPWGADFIRTREPVGSFIVSSETVVAVTLEFARLLKQRGESEEAIALLNRGVDLINDQEPNAAMEQLFVWHMCAGQVAEARALFDRKPLCGRRWLFMHAMTAFREHGEGVIARSAMHFACQNSQVMAHAFANDDLNEVSKCLWDVMDRTSHDDAMEFVSAMRPVFEAVPNLQQWLIDCACGSPSFANITTAVSSRPDVKPADSSIRNRYKRFKENIDLFFSFGKRGKVKEAKKYIRLALRESQKLPIGTWEIYATLRYVANMVTLEEMHDEVDAICAGLAAEIDKCEDLRLKSRVYTEIGCVLTALKKCKLAPWFFAHAGDFLETLHKTSPELDSLYELNAPLDKLAGCLIHDEKFEPAEQLFLRLTSIQAQYLPHHHPSVLMYIYQRAECFHKLGQHEEEYQLIDHMREAMGVSVNASAYDLMLSCDADAPESLN